MIERVCQDLYDGTNYPGDWHGFDFWGKAADFHEHAFFIWETIQKFFDKPLNIVETGRSTGQSTNLFSAIAHFTKGFFISYEIGNDWNINHIIKMNEKYGVSPDCYNYVIDDSANAVKYFPPDFKIDVLFLDSLHRYGQVKKETLLFENHLADKNIIFWHDTVWCCDSVLGWALEYVANKPVIYCKHRDTHKPQCEWCDRFGKPGMIHGRPKMVGDRPEFQSNYEVEDSPYLNKLQYNSIPWSSEPFEEAILKHKHVFTNIEACCGIGAMTTL